MAPMRHTLANQPLKLGLPEPKPSTRRVHVRCVTHGASVAKNARARAQIHGSKGPQPAKLAPALPPLAKPPASRAPNLVRRRSESVDDAAKSKRQCVRRNLLPPTAPFTDPNPIKPKGAGVRVREPHAATLATIPRPGVERPKTFTRPTIKKATTGHCGERTYHAAH